MSKKEGKPSLSELCLSRHWVDMSFYERFEHVVALLLTGLITIIVAVAMIRLATVVFSLLVLGALDPLDHRVFTTVFGMIMTLLIAMEFKHSILSVLDRKEHIIQVKTVILIALLALARKFIILDLKATSAASVAALALSVLVLGAVYWLLRERDDRAAALARTARNETAP